MTTRIKNNVLKALILVVVIIFHFNEPFTAAAFDRKLTLFLTLILTSTAIVITLTNLILGGLRDAYIKNELVTTENVEDKFAPLSDLQVICNYSIDTLKSFCIVLMCTFCLSIWGSAGPYLEGPVFILYYTLISYHLLYLWKMIYFSKDVLLRFVNNLVAEDKSKRFKSK